MIKLLPEGEDFTLTSSNNARWSKFWLPVFYV